MKEHSDDKSPYFYDHFYFILETFPFIFVIIDCFYIALFSALEQTHCVHVACDTERVAVSFYCALCNIHRSDVLTALLIFWLLWLVPCEAAAVSAHVLCAPYN